MQNFASVKNIQKFLLWLQNWQIYRIQKHLFEKHFE